MRFDPSLQLKFEISTFGPTVPKISKRGDEMFGDGQRIWLKWGRGRLTEYT
jgi:hypothetical protein